jgi:hypothetical protein
MAAAASRGRVAIASFEISRASAIAELISLRQPFFTV